MGYEWLPYESGQLLPHGGRNGGCGAKVLDLSGAALTRVGPGQLTLACCRGGVRAFHSGCYPTTDLGLNDGLAVAKSWGSWEEDRTTVVVQIRNPCGRTNFIRPYANGLGV